MILPRGGHSVMAGEFKLVIAGEWHCERLVRSKDEEEACGKAAEAEAVAEAAAEAEAVAEGKASEANEGKQQESEAKTGRAGGKKRGRSG